MPVKHRIRNSASREKRPSGLVQGKKPHRGSNAHKVMSKWPYYRAVLIWFAALALLFLAIATFGFGAWKKDKQAIFAAIALFGLWIFMKLMFFFASKATTCPLCRAKHYANSKSNKHKNAFKVFPLSYSSTAVITTVLARCIRCMHCGVTFDITKKYR